MVEALARCGVGSLILVDHDVISASNINRQLFALHSTVGQFKTEVAKARVRDIDSDILVHTYQTFYSGETAQLFDLKSCDYIVDAIDTVSSKLLLIENAKKAGVPIICSMGTGNKLDPLKFEITDISKTSVCPPGKSDASGTEKTQNPQSKSPLFQGGAGETKSAGDREKRQYDPSCPGQYLFRAFRGRPSAGRGSGTGSFGRQEIRKHTRV